MALVRGKRSFKKNKILKKEKEKLKDKKLEKFDK
jgi:hypothetical protein